MTGRQLQDALTSAENELATLRARIAAVTHWINHTHDHHQARTDLAEHLGLPIPTAPKEHAA